MSRLTNVLTDYLDQKFAELQDGIAKSINDEVEEQVSLINKQIDDIENQVKKYDGITKYVLWYAIILFLLVLFIFFGVYGICY